MNTFLSLTKRNFFLLRWSNFKITKKINFRKKSENGVEQLKKELEEKYKDQKLKAFDLVKNENEKIDLKNKIMEIGERYEEEVKSDIKHIGFDFSKFKNRNLELSKTKSKDPEEIKENPFKLKKEKDKPKDKDKDNKKEKNKDKDKEDKDDLKTMLDQDTFEKLEEMVSIDKTTEKTIGKSFDVNDERGVLTKVSVDTQQVIENRIGTNDKISALNDDEEDNEDKFKNNVLVHRPDRKHLWGLGEEVKNKKKSKNHLKKEKFTYGMYPTVEEIVSYLEMYNLQDILIVSRRELGITHLNDMAIITTGFNSKHLYKCAKDLILELKKLDLLGLPELPSIAGRKDEEWLIINIGDISIHFFTEKYRNDIDLIGKWTRKDDPEYLEFRTRLNLQLKQKKNSIFK